MALSNTLTVEKLLKEFNSTKIKNKYMITERSHAVFNKFRMIYIRFKYIFLYRLINLINKYSW